MHTRIRSPHWTTRVPCDGKSPANKHYLLLVRAGFRAGSGLASDQKESWIYETVHFFRTAVRLRSFPDLNKKTAPLAPKFSSEIFKKLAHRLLRIGNTTSSESRISIRLFGPNYAVSIPPQICPCPGDAMFFVVSRVSHTVKNWEPWAMQPQVIRPPLFVLVRFIIRCLLTLNALGQPFMVQQNFMLGGLLLLAVGLMQNIFPDIS